MDITTVLRNTIKKKKQVILEAQIKKVTMKIIV